MAKNRVGLHVRRGLFFTNGEYFYTRFTAVGMVNLHPAGIRDIVPEETIEMKETPNMKKMIALLLWAAMCIGMLAGCGGKDSAVVNTDGSTSMDRVVKGLAEVFMEEHPDVTVNYSGSGSGAGVAAAVSGTADIGLASRGLKDEEIAAGAVAHVIALDAVAVIVHPENPVTDLTAEQLAGIFTGEISDWSQLGGGHAPVAVYGREAGSGTRGAFEEIVGVGDECVYANEYSSTGDVVGSVAGNPNAIGYVSLAAVNGTVRTLNINGVGCTEEAVRDGSYPIQRPFVMITRAGAGLSEAAQAFLDYAKSEAAAGIIALAGAVAP